MMHARSKSLAFALAVAFAATPALSCTRTLFVGQDQTVLTGRTFDWMEDAWSNLWAFPAGLKRDGATGSNSIRWTSKYGSVVTSAYEAGTADGINEKGLVASLLYLDEADYGKPDGSRPSLNNLAWAQYVLDIYANVAEAVNGLKSEPFTLIAPVLPNGSPSQLHLALSDPSGDSAIFEYIGGKLVIHHGKQYVVMTNSPTYDKQLALDEYWKDINGLVFLPGTYRAADRFVRASFMLHMLPTAADENFIASIPEHSFTYQAVAEVMSVMRAVSVPLGVTTAEQPNIASTFWRTVADQKDLVYYFDSATRPNTFWVSLSNLDLKAGSPVRKLTIQNGEVFAGEVAQDFKDAQPFQFLQPATH